MDKTSAEITTLRHELSEEVTQVKDQVASVIEDVDKLKDNIDTIREDSKKTKDEIIQLMNEQINERINEIAANKRSGEIAQEQQHKPQE